MSVGIDFFEAFDDFVKASKHTKTEGTIKRYITLRNFLIHFSQATKYPIRFDTINLNFEEEFMDYAFEERKTLNNYYGKLISIIKTFMNWAFNRGLHNNLEFKKIKHVENEIEVIYLEKNELISLFEYHFENNKLSRARDFFCFGCFTGLRYSDIYNLHNANISESFIELNIIKTKTISHRVELNKYSKAILDKYKGTFQIQVKNPRMKPSIPFNIDELIESNRSNTEVTYVQLGTQVRLMILPKNAISKGNKIEMISTY